jgi:two-component system, LytTR family, response regulator
MISALIVDDEPLARQRIRQMLDLHPDVTVVGECGTAAELPLLVRSAAPALLLLDIKLAGGNGVAWLSEIALTARPAVIFLTAYPEYALEAFDLAAADYLLKPFDHKRFARAMARARRLIDTRPFGDAPPAPRHRERFAIRRRNEILFINAMEIDWIHAEGNYARLYTCRGNHLIRESLQSVAATLDPLTFIRVHRSAIVNVDRVVKLISGHDEGSFLVLASGDKAPLGPSYRSRIEELFGAA